MTAELIKHDHGRMYRCKIVPIGGPVEYGEWFGTESDVRAALAGMVRALDKRYYCEAKQMTCPKCETNEGAKVICAL